MYNENIWLDQESNPGPMQLKSGALSTELSRPIYCLHSPYLLLVYVLTWQHPGMFSVNKWGFTAM